MKPLDDRENREAAPPRDGVSGGGGASGETARTQSAPEAVEVRPTATPDQPAGGAFPHRSPSAADGREAVPAEAVTVTVTVYDRWEVQEADHPEQRSWYELPGDHASPAEAMEALRERREERPGYWLRIVRITHTETERVEPACELDGEPDCCPDDRDDLRLYAA